MAEVTKAMIFGVLKQLQSDVTAMEDGLRESTAAINALRTHVTALHQDVQNIFAVLARQDACLTRIERRLDIVEPA